jgi:hypothetical protein
MTWGGVTSVPAWFAGTRIFIQFVNGLAPRRTDETGGVTYMAHIGGFVAEWCW